MLRRLSVFALVPLFACGGEIDAETTEDALDPNYWATALPHVEYTWTQGESAKWLLPTSEAFCYLRRVGGNFRGEGEGVRLSIGTRWDGVSTWMLDGRSMQSGVHAVARCTRYTAFSLWGGGWMSPYSSEPAGWGATGHVEYFAGPLWGLFGGGSYYGFPQTVNLWDDQSFCYLSGLSGIMNGGGEGAKVTRTNTYGEPWKLTASSYATTDATTSGAAMCTTFGRGHPPLFAYYGAANEFTWTSAEPQKTIASAGTPLCYLTAISGSFASAGEYVETTRVGDGTWVLRGSVGGWKSATARCLFVYQ